MQCGMGFWKNLVSSDNSLVHTPYVFATIIIIGLATPIVMLSIFVVIYNIFYFHKPLDDPTTRLLLGLLGAVTGGMASALFARTTSFFSQTTTESSQSVQTRVPEKGAPKPDPPQEVF